MLHVGRTENMGQEDCWRSAVRQSWGSPGAVGAVASSEQPSTAAPTCILQRLLSLHCENKYLPHSSWHQVSFLGSKNPLCWWLLPSFQAENYLGVLQICLSDVTLKIMGSKQTIASNTGSSVDTGGEEFQLSLKLPFKCLIEKDGGEKLKAEWGGGGITSDYPVGVGLWY